MSANYLQKFLDLAKWITASRYLNVTRDGMALKRFEDVRANQEQDSPRGKSVAQEIAGVESADSDARKESLQQYG